MKHNNNKIVDDKRFVEQVTLLEEAQKTVQELSQQLQAISVKMFQVYSQAKYEEYWNE